MRGSERCIGACYRPESGRGPLSHRGIPGIAKELPRNRGPREGLSRWELPRRYKSQHQPPRVLPMHDAASREGMAARSQIGSIAGIWGVLLNL